MWEVVLMVIFSGMRYILTKPGDIYKCTGRGGEREREKESEYN